MNLHGTKEIGDFGERKAVHYLRRRGYTVKERNWQTGKMEIDIIAATLRDIVFVEVKTRTYPSIEALESAPPPHLAVNAKKQHLTRTAASIYLNQHPTHKPPRMDVIEVWLLQNEASKKTPRGARLHHIKSAY